MTCIVDVFCPNDECVNLGIDYECECKNVGHDLEHEATCPDCNKRIKFSINYEPVVHDEEIVE